MTTMSSGSERLYFYLQSGSLRNGLLLPPLAMILWEIMTRDTKVMHEEKPNPAYETWMQKDQVLVTYIIATLSEHVP